MWIGTKFRHEKVKTKRFSFPAEISREIASKISDEIEKRAESHTGDAQRFDYVPVTQGTRHVLCP
jgi:hypothetical protein